MASSTLKNLPIKAVLPKINEALKKGPVVVCSPTGSGKSTEVPRAVPRPVYVVEPRRVACRSLAARLAHLEGCGVGQKVGYIVRDDQRTSTDTEIFFVTPGVALRKFDACIAGTLILDELHERSLEIDLLLALARERTRKLVVMSATLDGPRVAAWLEAELVEAEGRTFPVEVAYDETGPTVPSPAGLFERVKIAVEATKEGDTLVFLPGKAEIERTEAALTFRTDVEVIPFHGGLSAKNQDRAFRPGKKRRIILSTNVAETSVTIPGITKVIDSGLVRQIRYHRGRGSLTLIPIARDSADQRAGRAGRTAPGTCLRLWKRHARLETTTPPEIYRLSLIQLVLAARAHGKSPLKLRWLDEPKSHSVEAAERDLRALGALEVNGAITERGGRLFRMPVDPWIGRFLMEAEERNLLDDAIDLASGLELNRPLFSSEAIENDPRNSGCDILTLIEAVRRGVGHPQAVRELKEHRHRLQAIFGVNSTSTRAPDREGLLRALLAADPNCARVKRARGKHTSWGGVGTEMELDARSAVHKLALDPNEKLPDAVLALGTRSIQDGKQQRLIITAASPVSLEILDEAKLGELRVKSVQVRRGQVVADLERVFAGKTVGRSEDVLPTGQALKQAVLELIVRNTLFKGTFFQAELRFKRWQLAKKLAAAGLIKNYEGDFDHMPAPCESDRDPVVAFVQNRLDQLGFEAQEDLQLLEPDDLLPESLPPHLEEAVERDYPSRVDLGEAKYEVRFDFVARRAVLVLVSGKRHKAPPRSYLPRFPGFKISIQAGGTMVDLG